MDKSKTIPEINSEIDPHNAFTIIKLFLRQQKSEY